MKQSMQAGMEVQWNHKNGRACTTCVARESIYCRQGSKQYTSWNGLDSEVGMGMVGKVFPGCHRKARAQQAAAPRVLSPQMCHVLCNAAVHSICKSTCRSCCEAVRSAATISSFLSSASELHAASLFGETSSMPAEQQCSSGKRGSRGRLDAEYQRCPKAGSKACTARTCPCRGRKLLVEASQNRGVPSSALLMQFPLAANPHGPQSPRSLFAGASASRSFARVAAKKLGLCGGTVVISKPPSGMQPEHPAEP